VPLVLDVHTLVGLALGAQRLAGLRGTGDPVGRTSLSLERTVGRLVSRTVGLRESLLGRGELRLEVSDLVVRGLELGLRDVAGRDLRERGGDVCLAERRRVRETKVEGLATDLHRRDDRGALGRGALLDADGLHLGGLTEVVHEERERLRLGLRPFARAERARPGAVDEDAVPPPLAVLEVRELAGVGSLLGVLHVGLPHEACVSDVVLRRRDDELHRRGIRRRARDGVAQTVDVGERRDGVDVLERRRVRPGKGRAEVDLRAPVEDQALHELERASVLTLAPAHERALVSDVEGTRGDRSPDDEGRDSQPPREGGELAVHASSISASSTRGPHVRLEHSPRERAHSSGCSRSSAVSIAILSRPSRSVRFRPSAPAQRPDPPPARPGRDLCHAESASRAPSVVGEDKGVRPPARTSIGGTMSLTAERTKVSAVVDRSEIDDLVERANQALDAYAIFDQAQIDRIVRKAAVAALDRHGELAELAVTETGRGVFEDKAVKNIFACEHITHSIATLRSVGVVSHDELTGITEIAEPVGVVCGVTPVTTPTSPPILTPLTPLKTRNPIVFAFHPGAQSSSVAAARVVREAAVAAGAPEHCVQWVEHPSITATNTLMHHPGVALILATGGNAMVRAAYSCGKPALGVGAGNVPAYIEKTAKLKRAVNDVVLSKAFEIGRASCRERV